MNKHLEEAIPRVYPQAGWQRCVAHPVRESLGQVRWQDRASLVQDLTGVYMAGGRREALAALEKFKEQ
ncbi:hypothetical protein YIM730264_20070 [Thermus hydrothermalis]